MKNDLESLARLLSAHATGDDLEFGRVAESLIKELTARNRHSEATYLQQALDRAASFGPDRVPLPLNSLPRNRRDGEALVTFLSRTVQSNQVFLCPGTRTAVDRLVLEQKRKRVLEKHGLRPKAKVLFWGPPGCGKTLTAQWLGSELGLPVGLVRLSSLVTSYVGETAANLQRVFSLASQTPMVLLLDEVDSIAKNRDDRNDVGELKRVVNSLLQAIDLFQSDKSLVLAASNHQYLLDEAVWRRFDDVVEFPLPSQTERVLFLKNLLSGVVFDGGYPQSAKQMNGLSFADIEAITFEVVKTMVLSEKESISVRDLTEEVRAFKEKRKRARSLANANHR